MAYKTIWDNNLIFPYEKRIEFIDSTIWLPDLIQFRYRVSENFFIENKDLFSIDSFKIREITEIIKKDRNANGAILGSMSPDSLKIILNDLKSLSCYGYLFFHARSQK